MSTSAWDLLGLIDDDQREFDPACIPPHLTVESATAFLKPLIQSAQDHLETYLQEYEPGVSTWMLTDAMMYSITVFGFRLEQLITINHIEVPSAFREALGILRNGVLRYYDFAIEDALPPYHQHKELIRQLLGN